MINSKIAEIEREIRKIVKDKVYDLYNDNAYGRDKKINELQAQLQAWKQARDMIGKVIDEWWENTMKISSTSVRLEELKLKLGIVKDE